MPHPMKLAEALEGLRANGSPEAETVLLKIDSLCHLLSETARIHRRYARIFRAEAPTIAEGMEALGASLDRTVEGIRAL